MKQKILEGEYNYFKIFIIVTIILVFLPFIITPMMAAEIVIMAIPVLSISLLLGYVGLLSFANGSLFATGAYTAGILLARHNVPIIFAILAGAILGGIMSLLIGYFCIKRIGIVFGMLSLAFNQLIWFIIWQWRSLTGGPDGIYGIIRGDLDLGFFAINLKPALNFYYFSLFFFLLTFFFTQRLRQCPFGRILLGVRESELRVRAIGYNPELCKWMAFTISGIICGLGGALFALHQEYVGEHLAHFSTSGEIVIMALLGGVSNPSGSIIGSGIYILLTDNLNKIHILAKTGGSLFFTGVLFIIVVLFLKGGIVGGIESIIHFSKKLRQQTKLTAQKGNNY